MPSEGHTADTGAASSWTHSTAVVLGLGADGMSAVDALHHLGANVIGIDTEPVASAQQEQADIFGYLGVDLRIGQEYVEALPANTDLVIASDLRFADSALLAEARMRGIDIWGVVELAWQARSETPAPWLAVAGPAEDAATTSRIAAMVESILQAAGVPAQAVESGSGNLLPAVLDPEGPAALIVELTEPDLHFDLTFSAVSTAVLHDIESSVNPFQNVQAACIYLVEDPATRTLVEDADVVEGARAIGVSRNMPDVSMIGVVEGLAVDRAFVADRRNAAEELFELVDLGVDLGADLELVGERTLEQALAAAALARSVGVPANHVRLGLQQYQQAQN